MKKVSNEFDIDVSGEDIFKKNYVVCVANKNELIKGFKITSDFINIINSKHGQGLYKYKKSKTGKSLLKIRIYSIIIYYLFKSLNIKESISINICRDFNGREKEINSNLDYFLKTLLMLKINQINFCKLDRDSNANKYAYLMSKDTKNKLRTYVNINLNEIEKFLIKK